MATYGDGLPERGETSVGGEQLGVGLLQRRLQRAAAAQRRVARRLQHLYLRGTLGGGRVTVIDLHLHVHVHTHH